MKTLLAVILLLTFVSVVQAEQVGDMDNDSQVGLREAIIALRIAAGLDPGVPLGEYIPATGNATAADVLEGHTFSNETGAGLAGTIKKYRFAFITPAQDLVPIPTGYYELSRVMGDVDLIEENIKSDTNLFGVVGNFICSYSHLQSYIMSSDINGCWGRCDTTYPFTDDYDLRLGCYNGCSWAVSDLFTYRNTYCTD